MTELEAILEAYDAARATGEAAVLATVASVSGSSYRRPGARMLITGAGEIRGAVSGGCLERDLLRRAGRLRPGDPGLLLRYDTRADTVDAAEREGIELVGLGCEGSIEIWVEAFAAEHPVLEALRRWRDRRARAALALVVNDGPGWRAGSFAVLEDGKLEGTLEDDGLRAALAPDLRRARRAAGREYPLEGARAHALIEPVRPAPELLVFGAGHDAVPVARIAAELGWDVIVIDCRSSLPVARRRFAGARAYVECRPDEVAARLPLPADARAIVMTHNFDHDLDIVEALLRSPVGYVGLLGPKARGAKLLTSLREERGYEPGPEAIARLRSPAGLDIGADSPEGIALSILAEAQASLAGRDGGGLRERDAPINDRGLE